MAFNNNIQFSLGQGGLNTPQPGFDYISGMIFKSATVPTLMTYSVAKQVFSIIDAQSLGIVGDYSDETKATAKITVSGTGSAGDTVAIKVVEPSINGTYNTVNIGSYTVQSSDTTVNTLATNISSFINTQYSTSGYQAATPTGGSFSVTAKVGLGTIINGTSPTITNVGTVNVSAAAFSGGVNSVRKEEHYQISEYFRIQPNGVLYIQYESTFGSWNCLNALQNQASNSIRQVGIYNSGATTSSGITADCDGIQAVANTLFAGYAPLSVIYSPNIYATSDLSSLPNLRTRSDAKVSCVIGQDGGALGAMLSKMYGKSVSSWGAVLGLVSFAKVSEDIGWVQKFNMSNGTELETVAISNNQTGNGLYSTLFANSFPLLSQLDAYGYIFNMKRPNLSGTWVNDSHTAVVPTSDYAYIERNRTIDKCVRNTYLSLAPLINGPLVINADGTLSASTISIIKNAEKPSMDAMVQNGEVSAYKITVDPRQNVLSTSTVAVVLQIVPIGVARTISVTLGFTTSI